MRALRRAQQLHRGAELLIDHLLVDGAQHLAGLGVVAHGLLDEVLPDTVRAPRPRLVVVLSLSLSLVSRLAVARGTSLVELSRSAVRRGAAEVSAVSEPCVLGGY